VTSSVGFADQCVGSPATDGTKLGFAFCIGVFQAAAEATGENLDFLGSEKVLKHAQQVDGKCSYVYRSSKGHVEGTIGAGKNAFSKALGLGDAAAINLIGSCQVVYDTNLPGQ